MTRRWSRRTSLLAALMLPAWPACAAASVVRVVSLDWGAAMTVLGLGVEPVGIAEQRLYADWVGRPVIPAGIADVGLRGTPSFETLAALEPDLILVNPVNTPLVSRLETIAPTMMNTTFADDKRPLERARDNARNLGRRLGCSDAAEQLVRNADDAIATARARLADRPARPVVPLNAVDGRHVTLFGPGSLYHDVLTALGLPTGAVGPTSMWGFRMASVADIAAVLPADLLVMAPFSTAAKAGFEKPGLWQSLLAAGGGRQIFMPASWAYGDITSAGRFATLVADALTEASG